MQNESFRIWELKIDVPTKMMHDAGWVAVALAASARWPRRVCTLSLLRYDRTRVRLITVPYFTVRRDLAQACGRTRTLSWVVRTRHSGKTTYRRAPAAETHLTELIRREWRRDRPHAAHGRHISPGLVWARCRKISHRNHLANICSAGSQSTLWVS